MVATDSDPRRAFVLNSVADAVAVGDAKVRLTGQPSSDMRPAKRRCSDGNGVKGIC